MATKEKSGSGNSAKSSAIAAKKCVTHEFRVSFPAVIKPKSYEGQEEKYSIVMLFPKKTNLSEPANGQKVSLKGAARAAAEEKWGKDKTKWPKNLRMPFRDGAEKETEGYEDCIFVSASSKTQPGLVDRDKTPILNEKDFYAGCYARAEVIAFAYDSHGNKGVSFSLQNVQKLKDGKPFSGRKNAEDVFDAVEDTSDDEDSYEDSDDSNDEGGF